MLVAAAVPLFDTVIDCDVLVWPTVTLPKERKLTEALTFGAEAAAPVPERLIDTLVPPLPVIVILPP